MTQRQGEVQAADAAPAANPGSEPAPEAPAQVDTVFINFTADVNEVTAESLLALLAQCHSSGAQTVVLLLSTNGGSVMHGVAVYNMLRAYPFRVITYNIGNVDSIGNTIFLAGDERYACPHTTFMFHGVALNAPAERQELALLRERLASIEGDNKRLSGIVAERANLSEEEATALYAEAKSIDTAEAVRLGLIHEVRQAEVPADAVLVNLSFPR